MGRKEEAIKGVLVLLTSVRLLRMLMAYSDRSAILPQNPTHQPRGYRRAHRAPTPRTNALSALLAVLPLVLEASRYSHPIESRARPAAPAQTEATQTTLNPPYTVRRQETQDIPSALDGGDACP
jgi:hypothetical protein